ncbi:enoyl-CoA hydratase [Aliidongia dinghuensis]|uniref:Enoyl-CoA hydratase n=1 Tax=Aliidongia dinghuensis TaxID=1867774 RepID=A0A8J2YX69_9PROT|nr:crotonase/enoyl-CoA hydratase family protein [Aliidongia dinghuensis]GGF27669.1 enoyl-CoA hydratase [Aliidongia dinghuensis]
MTDVPADGRILVEQRGPLLLMGIDRVPKRNGFSEKMVVELAEAFDRMEHDPAVRCGVLHALGPHFTAGLQLDQLKSWFERGQHLGLAGKVDPYNLRPPLRTKPVVAAVQGICFTAGIELMLAADVVVASADCRFGQIEVKRGIMANHGATIRMVERAGWGNAMRYLLTGDEFDAATALRLGFVQEVVEPGRQFERAIELAERIAAEAPLAVAATIRNATLAIEHGPAAAVAELGPVQQRLMASEDAAEGVASFREKREARFTGR